MNNKEFYIVNAFLIYIQRITKNGKVKKEIEEIRKTDFNYQIYGNSIQVYFDKVLLNIQIFNTYILWQETFTEWVYLPVDENWRSYVPEEVFVWMDECMEKLGWILVTDENRALLIDETNYPIFSIFPGEEGLTFSHWYNDGPHPFYWVYLPKKRL